MNGRTDRSRAWCIFPMGRIVIGVVAVLGLLISSSQAASPGPSPTVAYGQPNTSPGQARATDPAGDNGWELGETVLAQPVATAHGSDSVPYGTVLAELRQTTTRNQPAHAAAVAQVTGWRGEYYNNVNLIGSPLVRDDPKIHFDWGTRSPLEGIHADHFSARWTRRLDFEPGSYRFHVRIDDGVRLWVDGQLLIDQWNDGAERTYSAERNMTGGTHDVRVEMYERTGRAMIVFWRERIEAFPAWRGEYFANRRLAGQPALVRNDGDIDFNWGSGAPAAGLPPDNFSARWTRQLAFSAGRYRFTVEVDDGARLWVDGALIIDEWQDGIGSYSGDIYLAEGQHQVRMEMYEHTGGAKARLRWALLSDPMEWQGEYYANRRLAGQPALVRNDASVDFNWGSGAPAAGLPPDNFSVRWTRQLRFSAGRYRFTVEVDDGARLWVDGALLIDQWHDGVGSYSGDIYLAEGQHRVRMEMYEHTGAAMARLRWAQQEGFPEWQGEYYANRRLAGQPALVRNDASIDFNWGRGAPAAGLPADDFSVRWTRQLRFSAGHYRFTIEVDDGTRLWVDGVLIIDQWRDGIGNYTGDIHLAEGQHRVRMEMYEHTGGAKARLWWTLQTNRVEWKGKYYANRELRGKPALIRKDMGIDFRWGAGAPAPGLPADDFSVKWTSRLDFSRGTYRFCARADDGVSVEMNDRLPYIIREWHDGSGTYCNDVYVPAGQHKVTVEYFEHQGSALVQFWWQKIADG